MDKIDMAWGKTQCQQVYGLHAHQLLVVVTSAQVHGAGVTGPQHCLDIATVLLSKLADVPVTGLFYHRGRYGGLGMRMGLLRLGVGVPVLVFYFFLGGGFLGFH